MPFALFLLVAGLLGGQKPAPAPTPPAPLQPAPGNPIVVVSTSLGDVTIELFKDKAPVSVENFLGYVGEGFYAGTVFHRVIPGFMIQGGGFTDALAKKPTRPPTQNEAPNGLNTARGTLATARTAVLRRATSEFYITLVDNRALDHTGFSPDQFGYAVFGRVIDGMAVVDRIAAVPTAVANGMENVPTTPVVIKGVTVKSDGGKGPGLP